MNDDWVYDHEFYCKRCKRGWYELTLAYAVCRDCGNITWPSKCPDGCLRIRRMVEV